MFGAKRRRLEDAIRRDDADGVTRNFKGNGWGGHQYYDACCLAIESKASNALRALLEKNVGFAMLSYSGSPAKDTEFARFLVEKALLAPDPQPLLQVLYDANKKSDYRYKLNNEVFLSENTPTQFLQMLLDENPSLFAKSIEKTGLRYSTTEKLEFILTYTKIAGSDAILNNALIQAVTSGGTEKAKLLLEREADPNANGGMALRSAGARNNEDMVNLLLPHMDPGICRDVAIQLARASAAESIISSINASVQQKPAAATEPEPQETAANSFSRADDHTLVETQAMPDGSQLMSVYNFREKLLRTIFRDAAAERPTVPETTSFDKIAPEVIADMQKIFDGLDEKKLRVARYNAGSRII